MVEHGYLKWQLRRGKLELDVVLQRFVDEYPLEKMAAAELAALEQLLLVSDEELLDLVLRRKQAASPTRAALVEKIVGVPVHPVK